MISIHSWYSFGYDIEILKKALSMVKPGGKLIVNLLSQNSADYDLGCLSHAVGMDVNAETLSKFATEQGFQHDLDYEVLYRPINVFFDEEGNLTNGAKDFACFLIARPWNEMSSLE